MSSTVLVVDDEPNVRRVIEAQLGQAGFAVLQAGNGEHALSLLEQHEVNVVVTDLKMPGIDGLELMSRVRRLHPTVPVIIITAYGTVDNAVQAVKAGAFDYITKPFDKAELLATVSKAAKTEQLARRDFRPSREEAGRYRIIGETPQMKAIYDIIEKVADTPSTVLITGESGTGKELIAAALHYHSSRRNQPFIKINCAAIPRELMESELFGHEKGAFTGAIASKPGRFELADGGTLFLDEIADIPIDMQVKLLRALQEAEFERVGGIQTVKVDVRLVAASNRDLRKEVEAGKFREDLFYRLNVVPIALPPLRQRRADIPLLVDHFLQKFNLKLNRQVRGISPAALERIVNHNWPGNIRELENVIERCLLFAEGELIEVDDLPPELLAGSAPDTPPPAMATGGASSMKDIVRQATAQLERDLIAKALEQTNGNVTQAARKLKISRKSLQNKMKELGLRDRT